MTRPQLARKASNGPVPERAALILTNANVLTQVPDSAPARAVAIGRDGRIIAVGPEADVGNLPADRIMDMRGRTLIPGFFDCHMHVLWLGINLGHVSLASPPVTGAGDIVRLLSERLAERPHLTCVQGNRYDQNRLPGARHITRADLDLVSTSVPVRVVHTSGHAAVVNSRALQMLGITRDTPDPTGGEIERGPDGEPTGVLLETASWNDLDRILPETGAPEAVEALGRANSYLLARGITSASDANTSPHEIEYFSRAVLSGALRVRTNCMVGWAEVMAQAGDAGAPVPDALQPAGPGWHRLHVGQAKLFADGAITTRTCWLSEAFQGMPDNYGIPLHPSDELTELVRSAHSAGWQVATHAIGDRAVDLVLSAYAFAQRERPRIRPGHRIEHCMLLDSGLISRLRRQNVWSIGQPEFLTVLGEAYVLALGEERANRLSPYATLEARGVAQAYSSDCPVVPGSPLDGLRALTARATHSGRVLNPAERISRESALYGCTAASAYATRTERDRGTISAGKWADFAVLSHDPVTVHRDEWERVNVVATFVEGECLYGAAAIG